MSRKEREEAEKQFKQIKVGIISQRDIQRQKIREKQKGPFEDNLDRPYYNDFGAELRKIIDGRFSYNAIIKSVVIYTNEGILTLKREWRKIG